MNLDEIRKELKDINADEINFVRFNANTILQLCDEVERLQTQLEFTKEYLNPADTRFRMMIDSFKTLSKENQSKLIDLSKALLAIKEAEECMK